MVRCRRHAFTLVEMLIVLAIILLLLGILLPSLSRAREQARQAQCLSNIRQITQAYLSYAGDSESYFLPLDSSGAQVGLGGAQNNNQVIPALYPYLQNGAVFHCPSDPRDRGLSYAINDLLAGTYYGYSVAKLSPAKRLLDVRNAAGTFALIEETDFFPRAMGDPAGFVVVPNPSFTWIDAPAAPHGRGTCISFLDGHCEFWVWQDLRTSALSGRQHYARTPNNPDLTRLISVLGRP